MRIHLACLAVFASGIQFVTGQTNDTTITTDQEFSQSITSLVRRYEQDINAVSEKMNPHFEKAVNKAPDLEWVRRFESRIKRFREYGEFPVDASLIDLAAQEQYEKCLLSMSLHRVLLESTDIASKKKWEHSYDNCLTARERLVKENKRFFSLPLYSVLIPGAKFELIGAQHVGAEPYKVVVEIIHRDRGTITAKVKGKFWAREDGEFDRECKFALPEPTLADRLNNTNPAVNGYWLRESDLGETQLEIKSYYKYYKDSNIIFDLSNKDYLPVYASIIVLKATLKIPKDQKPKGHKYSNDPIDAFFENSVKNLPESQKHKYYNPPIATATFILREYFLENKNLTGIKEEYRKAVSIISTK